MSKIEAKKIVKKYAEKLKENNYPFSAIYLFGSYAKGQSHKWSDIDVAVISDKLRRNRDENENSLWHIRREVDSIIEPHGFTVKDFEDECDPMVYEIKKTGIKIA
ncbi:nucleotidyltransferase domain-containing protein [Candidatus Parcubacteria bacterium]|nr:nucleotidyltransferase domain-containing protein [Candidatus Parcubacteria bacterium]